MKAKAIIIVFLFLSFGFFAYSQRFKNGTYLFKYFDIEYERFNGTCKVIIKSDSVSIYAVTGCNRTPGTLIEKGLLIKNKLDKWVIKLQSEDVPSTIDFK